MPRPDDVKPPPDQPAIPVKRTLRWLLGIAWSHRWLALLAILSTIALQALALVSLNIQGDAIDLLRHRADPDAPAPGGRIISLLPADLSLIQTILILAALVIAFALVAAAGRYCIRMIEELFTQACIVRLRSQLYDHVQRQSFRFFDTHDRGQIINRLTTDAQSVREFIQGIMVRCLLAAVTFIVFLIFMLRENLLLTLVCLSVVPIQAGIMFRYSASARPMFLEQSRLMDELVRFLGESIAGVRVIRAFGREKFVTRLFESKAGSARDHRIKLARARAGAVPTVAAANQISMAFLLGFGGWLVIKGPAEGGIALGTLWVFRGLLERIAGQVETLIFILAFSPEALAGSERVLRLLEQSPDVTAPPSPATLPTPVRGRIEFLDVSFAYPDTPAVLEHITFSAEPGETIALVGPTGCGKSTLLSLVPRFYDPTIGRVLIDDIDLRELDPRTVRNNVAVVSQEPFLFSTTIRANVAYGRETATDDEILSALRKAHALEFVQQLEHGLDTIVGERGISLSGGQRQRLTIARALLMDAPILLLDDATGAVDSITETHIQRALDQHRQGRTTLIVAHRLSTLRNADRIIVLDKGRIVDIGTHEDLLDRPGHYRAAALIQLALEEAHEREEAAT